MILKENKVPWKKRLKEIAIDYIVILIYLLLLLGVMLVIYLLILKGIPEFKQWQSQLLITGTSVVPIILIFSFLDYRKGSAGKQKSGLSLYYSHKTFGASLTRNTVKFLPWQLGHLGTVRGIYTDFDLVSTLFSMSGMVLGLVLIFMVFIRRDKRHLGDFLAGTQIQMKDDE